MHLHINVGLILLMTGSALWVGYWVWKGHR